MDTKLKDKVVCITGASGGIGRATAIAFAKEGARLILHYRRNRESAEELARTLDVPSLVAQADVSDEAEVDRLMGEALSSFGQVDALVVNAGIWIEKETPIHELSLAQWQQTIDADLTGAFLCCRAFMKHLADKPRKEASIVLVGSTAALFGEANHSDYSAAKAGVSYGLTRSLKNEIVQLAPGGRVNCVCPGWVDTPMAAGAMEDRDAVDRATSTMPLRKIATAEDVAAAVVFFSSSALSGHLSGSILPIAGGMEGRLLHP